MMYPHAQYHCNHFARCWCLSQHTPFCSLHAHANTNRRVFKLVFVQYAYMRGDEDLGIRLMASESHNAVLSAHVGYVAVLLVVEDMSVKSRGPQHILVLDILYIVVRSWSACISRGYVLSRKKHARSPWSFETSNQNIERNHIEMFKKGHLYRWLKTFLSTVLFLDLTFGCETDLKWHYCVSMNLNQNMDVLCENSTTFL